MPASRQQIDEQAAEWMIRLHEGGFSDELRLEFERWKHLSPHHASAAARMQEVISRMQSLRPQASPAKAALNAAFAAPRKTLPRRATLRALLLAGCLIVPATLLLRSQYPQVWLADISTAAVEWKTVRLPDQSTLTLSGASAVDLHFDAQQRRIELLQGEVLIEVAHDPARPFIVHTAQGNMRALGTRFVVKRTGDTTVLSMLESRVAAQSENEQQTLEVNAGSQALIKHDAIELLGAIDPSSIDQAWKHHQLVVENQPLTQVLDEISRHRPGFMRFDRQALADLRVTAVLPLDDPERALNLIVETLPVTVKHFTPWLISINKNSAPEK
ncbi:MULTISPECIES: FecR family protein [unclassified Pseudomonas]|uniref:FecR family protein n=1 Tax=unclassified Pseudomonas TaxID=196821 RepID=UPI0007534856|nr:MULTISPECIES: FecR family protein [unclassified Pseudomonas]KVV10519.1 fec operon regulator FecR [Pseudomonas sp. TAD18]KVV10934.1 fec operon regulator FecR [Pseudomonas sp. TAA207]